ncbi:MAG: MMPL family transporter [Bacteroidia bacterium]
MVEIILKHSRWILAVLVVASLACAGGMTRLKVSHKMDDYFSANGEDLEIYNHYREIFGDDDQFLLLAIASDSGIYYRNFQVKLKAVKEKLKEQPGVEKVLWIDDWLPKTLRLTKSLTESIPESHLFISNDHSAVSLIIQHENIDDKEAMASLITNVKNCVEPFGLQNIHIVGKTYFTIILEKFMKEDSGWLFASTGCLVILLLFLILGSVRLLLIALVVPLLSIAFTLGIMGYLGLHINMFTTMVPTLILVISTSDIIHIVKGTGPVEGSQRVAYHFAALLLTSVTTAIGFASLLTTRIQAIVEFGGFVAIGVMYTFLLTITLFSLLPLGKYQTISILDKVLDWVIVNWVARGYRNRIVQFVTIAGFAVFIIMGIRGVRTNSYLLSGIPGDSEIPQNTQYFDHAFSGTRPLSIFVEKKDRSLLVPDNVFPRLDSLIRHHFHSRFLVGPQKDLPYEGAQFKVATEDRKYFRFYGLMNDEGSQVATRRYDSLTQAVAADHDFDQLKISYTGISRMADKNTIDISRSIMRGLFTALLITFIMLSIYFKGIVEAVISLVVNIIPLLALASLYGFLDIELRAGTSVAFSIAFGIAIDDTMHILATYKKQKSSNVHFDKVILDSGRPVLMTTLVLGISFSVLAFSGLEAVSVLGLSMVTGCIAALISDLVILPALIEATIGRKANGARAF